MADQSISGLPAATALAGTEQLPIAQNGETRRLTVAQLLHNTPTGTLAATTIQGAINELDAEKAPFNYVRPIGETSPGTLEWVHDGDANYLFHLVTGEHYEDGALIALGIGDGDGITRNEGGVGMLISNKKSGVGILAFNNSDMTLASAYTFKGTQNSTVAGFMYLESAANGAAELLKLTSATAAPTATQVLQRWQSITGGPVTFGYDVGRVYAADGRLEWFADVRANGTKLIAHGLNTASATLDTMQSSAAWLDDDEVRLRKYSGSPGTYYSARLLMGAAAGPNYATLAAAQPFGHSPGTESWAEMITFDKTHIGFFGATPVTRPTGTPAAATDAATTMALANSLRAALLALGLVA